MNEGFIEAKPCAESAKKTRYYYVAFKGSGFFVRKGDGGYRNWAFYGVFTRGQGTDSNRVTFQARTCYAPAGEGILTRRHDGVHSLFTS